MIVCRRCESAQFLQIVSAEIGFDGDGDPDYVVEEYVCTFCDAEGNLDTRRDEGDGVLRGSVAFATKLSQ